MTAFPSPCEILPSSLSLNSSEMRRTVSRKPQIFCFEDITVNASGVLRFTFSLGPYPGAHQDRRVALSKGCCNSVDIFFGSRSRRVPLTVVLPQGLSGLAIYFVGYRVSSRGPPHTKSSSYFTICFPTKARFPTLSCKAVETSPWCEAHKNTIHLVRHCRNKAAIVYHCTKYPRDAHTSVLRALVSISTCIYIEGRALSVEEGLQNTFRPVPEIGIAINMSVFRVKRMCQQVTGTSSRTFPALAFRALDDVMFPVAHAGSHLFEKLRDVSSYG